MYDSQNVSVGSISYTCDIVQTYELGVNIVYHIMIVYSVLATAKILLGCL